MSRTTEWRRRKFGNPTDGRGRKTNDVREERIAFVGAVVAQLLKNGFATHGGLKTYGQRIPTARESELKTLLAIAMETGNADLTKAGFLKSQDAEFNAKSDDDKVKEILAWIKAEKSKPNPDMKALKRAVRHIELIKSNPANNQLHHEKNAQSNKATVESLMRSLHDESMKAECGDGRPAWVAPPDAVMDEIRASSFNADCMALAAAHIGQLEYIRRDASLRGVAYSSKTPVRESSFIGFWKAIDGMTRQTSSYWRSARKAEYNDALHWLFALLKRSGFDATNAPDEVATLLRDDLADATSGKLLKIPKIDGDARFADEKQLAKIGMESMRRRD